MKLNTILYFVWLLLFGGGVKQEKNNCREEGDSVTREKEKKHNDTKGGACSLLIAVQSGK